MTSYRGEETICALKHFKLLGCSHVYESGAAEAGLARSRQRISLVIAYQVDLPSTPAAADEQDLRARRMVLLLSKVIGSLKWTPKSRQY